MKRLPKMLPTLIPDEWDVAIAKLAADCSISKAEAVRRLLRIAVRGRTPEQTAEDVRGTEGMTR